MEENTENRVASESKIKHEKNQERKQSETSIESNNKSSSLGKRRKGTKSKKSHSPVVDSRPINYKNLDEWLENSIKGMHVSDNDSPIASASNIHQPHLMNPINPFYSNILPPYSAGMRPWSDLNCLNLPNFATNTPFTNHSHTHLMNNNVDFVSLPPMAFNTTNSNNNHNSNSGALMDGSSKDTSSVRSSNHHHNVGGGDSDQNRTFQQDQIPGHLQASGSTTNFSSSNRNANLTTSDDSDDTKESTSISKTSLKIDESQITNPIDSSYMTLHNLNLDNNNSGNSKLLLNLIKQINLLHETNTKIFRNLQETKVELEVLKNAPSWGIRHRRDSISGISLHSQPLGNMSGYHHGAQSPAPTYHSQGYTPGVVTDVIREVREGTRVREEALLNRVKNMIEERQWSINETNLRVVRELEELKIQMHQMKLDKKHTDDKIARLESEVASLRNLFTHSISIMRPTASTFEAPPFMDPRDFMRQVRPSNDSKRLSLNFGTMNAMDLPTDSSQFNAMSSKRNGTNLVADNESVDLETNVDGQLVQLERDTLELRRELQDAIASKKASESKILALEKLVTSLKNRIPNSLMLNPQSQAEFNQNQSGSVPDNMRHSLSPQPQKAATIQTVSPKSIIASNLSLNGPVTDL